LNYSSRHDNLTFISADIRS